MLDLNLSPPDADDLGKSWVARGIEEFNNGEWVAELAQLHTWGIRGRAKEEGRSY
jgi:hypothetical protein